MDLVPKLWEVIHIREDIGPEQSTVEVYAAKIQPTIASLLIRKLNFCAPLVNLGHLKRVRRRNLEGGVELDIILCTVSDDVRGLSSRLPHAVYELVEEYRLQPFRVTIPGGAASTREEWVEQCTIWPTCYHPNAVNLKGAAICFESDELRSICEFMRAAISQAKLAATKSQPRNGAVIVDPAFGHIVSVAHDETGGWIGKTCGIRNIKVVNGSLSGHHACHPLRHAVMVAIERAAANEYSNEDLSLEFDRSSSKRVRATKSKENMGESSSNHQQYLCTGFDAYITREPCSMCAMALLHQRVRRVFYGISNPAVGALGGLHTLQGKTGLNHHYSMFQVALREDDLCTS